MGGGKEGGTQDVGKKLKRNKVENIKTKVKTGRGVLCVLGNLLGFIYVFI